MWISTHMLCINRVRWGKEKLWFRAIFYCPGVTTRNPLEKGVVCLFVGGKKKRARNWKKEFFLRGCKSPSRKIAYFSSTVANNRGNRCNVTSYRPRLPVNYPSAWHEPQNFLHFPGKSRETTVYWMFLLLYFSISLPEAIHQNGCLVVYRVLLLLCHAQ